MKQFQTLVPGNGLQPGPEGSACLTPESEDRGWGAINDYRANTSQYDDGGLIIVSGNCPVLYRDMFGDTTEAELLEELLIKEGVPPELIVQDPDAITTLTNYLNSIPFFDVDAMTPENPLRVVGPPHRRRRLLLIGRHVLNTPNITVIPTPNRHVGLRVRMQERVITRIAETALSGVKPGDIDALRDVDEVINERVRTMRENNPMWHWLIR